MPEATLRDRHILVVEDEYMLAEELRTDLSALGATVIGPAGTVAAAIDLVRREAVIDGGILDIHLRGETSFALADRLIARGVPIVFATGYGAAVIPARFSGVTRFEKPIPMAAVARAIVRAAGGGGGSRPGGIA